MKNELINYLSNKNILILGLGREGQSMLRFIQENMPSARVTVADQNELRLENVPTICGPDYLATINDYDLVVKSPGIPTRDFPEQIDTGKITSMTDLFLRFCKNPVVGITGTKGKSTTASLIYHIFHTLQHDAILVGNIGKPCFDYIDNLTPETIIVFELSCHQLEFLRTSPHVAILLNLYDEHFDHYKTPADYFASKKHIYQFQTEQDTLIYGDIFQHASQEEINQLPSRRINIFQDIDIPAEQIHTSLVGEHNLTNIRAAVAACETFGLQRADILATIPSFQGLPHRLEYVGKFHDIDFYNDSIATAQEAVINAVKALQNVNTLILGGMDRGLDYRPLVEYLRQSNVQNILLLPNTTGIFLQLFQAAPHQQKLIPVANMADAVDVAFERTTPGSICLLSPAAASYHVYKNFEERGKDFCNLVRNYNNKNKEEIHD